jgi:DNA-directed RNA polymerase beta' subunit
MRYPVINPLALRDLPKWLKITCFKCGYPVTKTQDYLKLPRANRLALAYKEAEDAKLCARCGEQHGIVRKDPKQPLRYVAEYYKDDRKQSERVLFPHVMKEILAKISDQTVFDLGCDPVSHPRNFILDAVKVPSVLTRPDVKKIGGGRSTNDDLTTMLQLIEKLNEQMPNLTDGVVDLKTEKHIYDMCTAYYNFIKGPNDGNFTSLGTRLKGKQGKFRKTMLGKRSRKMCRSTITGDPRLKINEVGVPMVFAKTIQMKEIVQDFNRQRVLSYIANGVNKYPGCTKIVKRSTGAEYLVSSFVENEHELENGDVVHRDMITGDVVFFNRQPSLKNTNITALRAVICEDPKILTLRMNVIDTKLFNADFKLH